MEPAMFLNGEIDRYMGHAPFNYEDIVVISDHEA